MATSSKVKLVQAGEASFLLALPLGTRLSAVGAHKREVSLPLRKAALLQALASSSLGAKCKARRSVLKLLVSSLASSVGKLALVKALLVKALLVKAALFQAAGVEALLFEAALFEAVLL